MRTTAPCGTGLLVAPRAHVPPTPSLASRASPPQPKRRHSGMRSARLPFPSGRLLLRGSPSFPWAGPTPTVSTAEDLRGSGPGPRRMSAPPTGRSPSPAGRGRRRQRHPARRRRSQLSPETGSSASSGLLGRRPPAAGLSRRPVAPGHGRQLTDQDPRHRRIGAPGSAWCRRVAGVRHPRSAVSHARMTSRVRRAQPSRPPAGLDEQNVIHRADHSPRAPLNALTATTRSGTGWAGGPTQATPGRLLHGLEGRGVVICGIRGHGGASLEREVEGAVVEVGAGGGGGAVDVDTLGGWKWRVDGGAEGGGGAEEGGAALVVPSQDGDTGQALEGKRYGSRVTGLACDLKALDVVGLGLVSVTLEFGGVAEPGLGQRDA